MSDNWPERIAWCRQAMTMHEIAAYCGYMPATLYDIQSGRMRELGYSKACRLHELSERCRPKAAAE